MVRKIVVLIFAMAFLAPAITGAVTPEDFTVRTTQDLVDLCTVNRDDPLADEAISFCHGYCVGAYHYYLAENSGPEGNKWVCFPDPAPSRNYIIGQFVEWTKAHPEYADSNPVESIFRFLIETYPCGK